MLDPHHVRVEQCLFFPIADHALGHPVKSSKEHAATPGAMALQEKAHLLFMLAHHIQQGAHLGGIGVPRAFISSFNSLSVHCEAIAQVGQFPCRFDAGVSFY
jgi:hypothetical protein